MSTEGNVVAAQVSEGDAVGGASVSKPVPAVQPKYEYAFVALTSKDHQEQMIVKC